MITNITDKEREQALEIERLTKQVEFWKSQTTYCQEKIDRLQDALDDARGTIRELDRKVLRGNR